LKSVFWLDFGDTTTTTSTNSFGLVYILHIL
jgi:hypothetical protein